MKILTKIYCYPSYIIILRSSSIMNIVKKYHSELLKYKNIHVGDVCYIFGSGPTFNRFKIQEEGIFIGCNHIIKNKYIRENIKYYFFGHGYKYIIILTQYVEIINKK